MTPQMLEQVGGASLAYQACEQVATQASVGSFPTAPPSPGPFLLTWLRYAPSSHAAQCPGDMVFRSVRQCRQEGGPCPRLCLVQGPGVECAGLCSPGCTCPAGLFLHDASCLPCSQCPCQLHGQLCAPGEVAQLDSCNNW